MNCDFSGIVTKVSLFPKQCSQNIFLCENVFDRVIQVELLVFDH